MSFDDQYQALKCGAGAAWLEDRTQVELRGRDRTSFLHSMCTNDIKGLSPGQTCEAFLTNVQGKTIAYCYVHCLEDSLVLDTEPGQGPLILESLDRYLIREDVQLSDRSLEWSTLLLSGDASAGVLGSLGVSSLPASMGHVTVPMDGKPVSLRNIQYCNEHCLLLSCPAEDRHALLERLCQAGAVRCDAQAIEVRRIEMGTPRFGIDITSDNLPQEIDRNASAISFTKGCYLGQETVARIDARGHVNRLLVGLRLDTATPPQTGTVLQADSKPVARITSACLSPALNAPLALAFVRRGFHTIGTCLETDHGAATVVPLPVETRAA